MTHPTLLTLDRDFKLRGGFTLMHSFYLSPSQASYDAVLAVVQASKVANSAVTGVRYLITLADGTVVADTSKTNNSYQNFLDKTINETHFTRIAIATSLLSVSGLGDEEKFSSSTRQNEIYHAVRVGKTPNNALGVMRYSFREIV